jgi:hypothetical protein
MPEDRPLSLEGIGNDPNEDTKSGNTIHLDDVLEYVDEAPSFLSPFFTRFSTGTQVE